MNTNRAVSVLVCLQALEIVACTLTVSLILKLFSASTPNPEEYRQLAFWVRSWGFSLLLVPALWASIILYLKQKADIPAAYAASGYYVMAALFVFYASAAYSAGRMPIIQITE